MKKNKKCQRGLGDTIKDNNVCIMRISEGKDRKQEEETIFKEIVSEGL